MRYDPTVASIRLWPRIMSPRPDCPEPQIRAHRAASSIANFGFKRTVRVGRRHHLETAMLRDDSGNGAGRRNTPRNVLGDRLELCSINPMTGFFRDGCCDTRREDVGSHTVCAVMTAAFLEFSKIGRAHV